MIVTGKIAAILAATAIRVAAVLALRVLLRRKPCMRLTPAPEIVKLTASLDDLARRNLRQPSG